MKDRMTPPPWERAPVPLSVIVTFEMRTVAFGFVARTPFWPLPDETRFSA